MKNFTSEKQKLLLYCTLVIALNKKRHKQTTLILTYIYIAVVQTVSDCSC